MKTDNKHWALPEVPDHALRETLTNEIHARPALDLRAPARISHLAMLSGEQAGERERQHILELCRRFGVAEPAEAAKYWYVDLGAFRLNWERHTEFSTHTFIRQEPFSEPFRDNVIAKIPRDWLEGLAGEILVAIHLALEPRDAPEYSLEELTGLFASDNIAGSELSGGAAVGWTDFRLQGDGFSRILIRDTELGGRQAGRLVQRLLDIETYRMMALLALPLAREVGVQVSEADRRLAQLTDDMACADNVDAEHALFGQLSQLAADIERLAAKTNYRFSAAHAYYVLVQRRIAELREKRMRGRSTIQEFMDRRLAPAMSTCESVRERIDVLSRRVSRASDLLRTRVDLALEQQNRDLLESMNRRAEMQLRLQETVEGLSIVVLSYYTIGLISYVLKAAKEAGWPVNPELLSGLAVPLVAGGIWLGMEWLRKVLIKDKHQNKH
jgi:uncharacterized membrane-anchored protein